MSSISLGTSGYQAIKQGLPERRLVDYLKNGKNRIQEISNSGFFSQKESHSAFRYAKQNNWIEQAARFDRREETCPNDRQQIITLPKKNY